VFENRVPRRIFELKKAEVTGGWRKFCLMRSFITCTLRQVKSELSCQGDEMRRICNTHDAEEECI
jgi:hypothetical protein